MSPPDLPLEGSARKRAGALATLLVTLVTACAAPRENGSDTPACTVEPPPEPVICTQQYDPVCGCDGKTYGNACTARGAGVSSHVPGACDNRLD